MSYDLVFLYFIVPRPTIIKIYYIIFEFNCYTHKMLLSYCFQIVYESLTNPITFRIFE